MNIRFSSSIGYLGLAQLEEMLSVDSLLELGRTLRYKDLPSALWQATGYRLRGEVTFREFGMLRNAIQHLAVPTRNLAAETLTFLFDVVQEAVLDFWDESIFDYIEKAGDEAWFCTVEQLDFLDLGRTVPDGEGLRAEFKGWSEPRPWAGGSREVLTEGVNHLTSVVSRY